MDIKDVNAINGKESRGEKEESNDKRETGQKATTTKEVIEREKREREGMNKNIYF